MLKNKNKGFTLAESILSIAVMMVIAIYLLPFLVKSTGQTKEKWGKAEGMRQLYEQAEKRVYQPEDFRLHVDHGSSELSISWETMPEGKTAACLRTEAHEHCIQEQ